MVWNISTVLQIYRCGLDFIQACASPFYSAFLWTLYSPLSSILKKTPVPPYIITKSGFTCRVKVFLPNIFIITEMNFRRRKTWFEHINTHHLSWTNWQMRDTLLPYCLLIVSLWCVWHWWWWWRWKVVNIATYGT